MWVCCMVLMTLNARFHFFFTSVMEGHATYRKTNVLIWELIQDFNHHYDAL